LHRALRATTKPAVLSRVDKRKLRATDDNLSPLLAWRLRSGLSQGDLAAALGVCASVLSRIEHGQAGFNDKVINFLNQQLGEAEANEMILAQERFVGDTMRRIRSVLRDQEVAA
jgi:transcriptional regulator with XRE-family HTH domain